MASEKKIPTSRVRRTAQIGSLAASQAIRQAGTRAANVARSEDAAQVAMSKRQLEAAEQIVDALGKMKGAAMKLGQVLSFLDVGLVPEEHREEFQKKLGKLRDAAPKVSFEQMRAVIEQELDASIDEVFAEFDRDSIAAASIGQVYRARLHDGREVAVKVQYPGIASAVRADMKNLGLILRIMKGIAPGLDPKEVGDEIRLRIDEELDYELEAQNQRSLARVFDGHPFIRIPDVVTELSRERVIVSEFVQGKGFEEIKELGQQERDRIGEIIFRFFFSCLLIHRQFSGDPHPGNFMLLDDGTVAFFDFGLFKRVSAETVNLELETFRFAQAGDSKGLVEHFHRVGVIDDPKKFDAERILAQFNDATWWYGEDREVTLTPEIATQVMIDISDPRSQYFDQMRKLTMPPEHLFARRMEMLTLAVLGQLGVTANWYSIACEWVYGEKPRTALGVQEADFYSSVG